MKELIAYFERARKLGISEFRLVDHGEESDVLRLYIHPLGRDGVSANI